MVKQKLEYCIHSKYYYKLPCNRAKVPLDSTHLVLGVAYLFCLLFFDPKHI